MDRYQNFSELQLVSVCDAFLEGESVKQIVEEFNASNRVTIGRESVYPILREARRRGYFAVTPPPNLALQQRVQDRYQVPRDRVSVLYTRGRSALDHVTRKAADLIVDLIRDVAARKREKTTDAEAVRVRIGLTGGGTIMRVARELAARIGAEPALPKLGLHALSSGFDVRNPRSAPASFLGFFDQSVRDLEYVGLFAPAVVEEEEYETVKKNVGVRQSFEASREIDVVVTSLASATDEHGELNEFMNLARSPGSGRKAIGSLRKQGWVGDVSYRPYSRTGPITANAGIRAVSIFELSDLVRLARQPNSHVVLVAAPCAQCLTPKGDALLALLREKKLRLWTHLVMDMDSAQSVLERDEVGA